MKVIINGKEHHLERPMTVAELLDHLSLPADRVVVECDRTIVGKEQYADFPLSEGMVVEIVRFVGGG